MIFGTPQFTGAGNAYAALALASIFSGKSEFVITLTDLLVRGHQYSGGVVGVTIVDSTRAGVIHWADTESGEREAVKAFVDTAYAAQDGGYRAFRCAPLSNGPRFQWRVQDEFLRDLGSVVTGPDHLDGTSSLADRGIAEKLSPKARTYDLQQFVEMLTSSFDSAAVAEGSKIWTVLIDSRAGVLWFYTTNAGTANLPDFIVRNLGGSSLLDASFIFSSILTN